MFAFARRFGALACAVLACATQYGVQAIDGGLAGTVRVGGKPQKDVVVWLDELAPHPSSRQKAVMDQRNLTFSPRVLAIRVGTSVSMPNNDRVFHNVFSFRDGKRFDLGLYPVGKSKAVTFDKAGVSRMFCNIHPNMAAYVVAVDSDYFAVTDAAGAFAIADVPAGDYVYHAWRAGHEPATGRVTVSAERNVELDLP